MFTGRLETILYFMEHTEHLSSLKAYYKQLVPTMTEESWQVVARIATIRKVKKGEYLVREGEVCDHVSFINYGLVRMFHIVDGREKIIAFTNEFNYASEYQSFLTRKPANSFLQAMEATEVVDISFAHLQMLYREVPEANQLGRLIAENLFLMMCDMSRAEIHNSITGRYQQLVEDMPWLPQRVPQYMIASYLGITPEAFSRIKAKASKQKVLN
jgi:CRP-like cAMP-binding protein